MATGPPDRHVSRRTVLKATSALAGLAATGSLAGCQDPSDTLGGGDDLTANVPQGVEVLMHFDVNAILSDDALRDGIDELLAEMANSDEGPQSTEEALDDLEEEAGLDFRAVSEFLVFGNLDDDPGSLVWADWTTDELVDTMEQEGGTTFETETYADRTVYVDDGDLLVALSEDGGPFAIGPRDVVERTVDVWDGNADPLGGEMADLFGDLDAGYLRVASEMPAGASPPSEELSDDAFEAVTHVTGSFYPDGDERVGTMNLHVDSEETAQEIADSISGLVSRAQQEIESNQEAAGPEATLIIDQLDRVETRTDGAVAVIEYRGPADEFGEFIATFIGQFVFGLGVSVGGSSRSTSPRPPAISFQFDYEETGDGRGQLTIVHEGGDSVGAKNLRIVGDRFADVEGVEMTSPGPWQGGTSDGEVLAGNRVTVGVQSDCEIRVVWEGGDQSAVLAEYHGPDA